EVPAKGEQARLARGGVSFSDREVPTDDASEADRPDSGEVREAGGDEHRPEQRSERHGRDLRDLEAELRDALVGVHGTWAAGGRAEAGEAGRGGGFESTSIAATSSTAIATALSPARLRGRRARIRPSPRSTAGRATSLCSPPHASATQTRPSLTSSTRPEANPRPRRSAGQRRIVRSVSHARYRNAATSAKPSVIAMNAVPNRVPPAIGERSP